MPGLTAKVFRTFNASYTLEKELAKESISKLKAMTVDERVLVFNRANREVAILCNHQRTVSKNHEAAMGKLENQINELKEEKRALKQHLKDVKSGKVKKEVKKETKVKKEESDDESDESEEEKKKTPAKKRKRADEDEKLTKEELKAEIKKEIKKEDGEKPVKEKKPMPDDPAKIEKRIKDLDARIAKFEVKKQERDDLKQVALGTSKINYIDPRITIAWCKKVDVPITKVFSRTLRDKFPWAIAEVDDNPGYKF
jgi:DNA topoisomerase-1